MDSEKDTQQTEHDERIVRTKKLAELREKGVAPYPNAFSKTHSAKEIEAHVEEHSVRESEAVFASPTEPIKTAGRVITIRDHGKLIFADVQDESGIAQICFKRDVIGEEAFQFVSEYIDPGDFIGISGEPFITKQDKLAVLAVEFILLSKALRPLPGKYYGLENTEARYRKRYLDMVVNRDVFERFVKRSQVVEELRQWLLAKNFTEVSTRTLQSKAGGAMAETFTTHHNALGHDFHLRIAPELDLKMLVAGGFERVFEFAINFRNEGIDASHLQEFQMLEWYAAYKNFEDGMEWTEEMLAGVAKKVFGTDTFTVFDKNERAHEITLASPIPRMRFDELMQKEAGVDVFTEKETLLAIAKEKGLDTDELAQRSRGAALDEIYKKAVRPTLIAPVFVTHYPVDLVPLARPSDEDSRFAESYQLLIAGWEIVKAYSELVDPELQRKKFEEQAKAKRAGDAEAMEVNEEFLTAMEHGMPPMTGWGMGIDRFVTLLAGQKNLRESVFFPLMRPERE